MQRDLLHRRPRTARASSAALVILLGVLLVPAGADAQRKKKKTPQKAKADEALVIGTVVNTADGSPLAGVRIVVSPASAPDLVVAEAVSDAAGELSLVVPQPAGEYRFRLESRATATYEQTVPLQPGETAQIGFELVSREIGQRQEAIRAFNAAADAFNREDFAQAKAQFLEATQLDPSMVEPYLGLAEIYFREESYQAAAEAVERYLAEKSDDAEAKTLAYMIYREAGDTEKADRYAEILATSTDKARGVATRTYNEGARAWQQGDLETAVERFRKAVELDPTLAQGYSSLASILYNAERYDEAHAALDKLFELEPDDVQGRRVRFLLYDFQNDPRREEALEAYLAVDVDGAVDIMYQRADLDFRDGNTAKAQAALERILELRPELPRAHYTLGLCYMQSDEAKAKEHLERFIELAPDDPEAASAKDMLSYLK